jgi:hypothetical protein
MEKQITADTTLSCGHKPTPRTSEHDCGTGYGTDNDGNTRCYACAEEYERELFKVAGDKREPFAAYLKADASGNLTINTWTGGKLADVVSTREIPLTRMSFTHGRNILTYTARDAHGREWYGRGNAGIITTLRRKGK